MLSVGVPREIKPEEKRVGLTPAGVRELKQAGITVWVEKGAGEASGFSDEEYRKAGAEIAKSARELYQKAGLVKKVKEPLASEWEFLKPDLVLFSFLHLGSPENRKLLDALLERKVAAIGYETVQKEGRDILLEPMSEIAGTLAAYFAGFFRRFVRVEGRKIVYPPRFVEKLESLAALLPEVPEKLSPGRVVIFGGGVVGRKASEMFLKMGGEVDLIEKRAERREVLKHELRSFGPSLKIWSVEEHSSERLEEADVWVGAVHVTGERAPVILLREEFEKFCRAKPKLILDVAVDQGGNFPETHSTTYEDPLYLDSLGNLRFGVANIPSLCKREASLAIERVTLAYTVALAQEWKKALQQFPELQKGLQVAGGKVINEAIFRTSGKS